MAESHPHPPVSHAWLGALQALALADDDFSPQEQRLLSDQLEQELPGLVLADLTAPDDATLRRCFAGDPEAAGQFLRSAAMVALADGHLSEPELDLLRHWSDLLGVGQDLMRNLEPCGPGSQPLDPLRRWLDGFRPEDPLVARFLVRLIPSQCPFERDITLFGRKVVHIPPMCQINPLYDQLVGLRFRALERLAEQDSDPPAAAGAL
jgi:hypothetical protein